MVEETIDLRRYIKALIRCWWLVLGLPIIAAIVALLANSTARPIYEARVYVAATKLKVDVQFGSQIETLTEEELATVGGWEALSSRQTRLAAFRALVANPQIAQIVLPQFADRLRAVDENLLDPACFLKHVSSKESQESAGSDLIVITISLPDPQLAADIANAWGQAYEQFLNQLYSGIHPQDVASVQEQTAEARQAYLDAQSELEAYLANNPTPRLDHQISILQAQIDSFHNAIVEMESLAISQELSTRQQLLNEYYGDLVTLQRLLDGAYALKQQLQLGESSPPSAFGDALAMILLRSRAFAGVSETSEESEESDVPFSLQLQTPLAAENVAISDVENLIQVLETRKAETEVKIENLTATLLDPLQYTLDEGAGEEIENNIEELTVEIQALQAELEAETARQRDLERQRDLAWDTYSTLAMKEAEVQVAAQSGSTEVRVASLAVPPTSPTGSNRSRNAAIAGGLGLTLGILGALALEWWQGEGEEEKPEEARDKTTGEQENE